MFQIKSKFLFVARVQKEGGRAGSQRVQFFSDMEMETVTIEKFSALFFYELCFFCEGRSKPSFQLSFPATKFEIKTGLNTHKNNLFAMTGR